MNPTEAEILESVTVLIDGVLILPILERHRRDVVSGMLWKVTEACGKYRTRYRSHGATEPGAKVQHELVFRRNDIKSRGTRP